MNTEYNKKDATLSQRVLGRISGEHLTPRPRWEFLFKNYTFWTLGALAVVLGALAFAATLFEIQTVDWRLSSATHTNFLSFFLDAAPLLWISAITLFILIGYINVRRTSHGYRYSFTIIAICAVLVSLSLGSGIYAIGFGGEIDEAIGGRLPFYRPTLLAQRSWWLAPEKGLLTGQVTTVNLSTASFTLRDSIGRDWNIDSNDLPKHDITLVTQGEDVRIVGVPATTTSSDFHACFVFKKSSTTISNSSRKRSTERGDECKNIRPYKQLRNIEIENDLHIDE